MGARRLLTLDEGSLVKLGENARLVIEKARRRGGVFEASVNVATGVFRFTTQTLSRGMPRDVRITLADNATIDVRGADLWGRAREDKDIVCLIEGKIEITGNDRRPLALDLPRQRFQSTRSASPEPVGFLIKQHLEAYVAETEIEFGKAASMKGGWKVVIDGFASRDEAPQAARNLRVNGYPAELTTDNTLTIARMQGELAARQLAARLKGGSGFKEVRIAQ